jgi:hypothetical protein
VGNCTVGDKKRRSLLCVAADPPVANSAADDPQSDRSRIHRAAVIRKSIQLDKLNASNYLQMVEAGGVEPFRRIDTA